MLGDGNFAQFPIRLDVETEDANNFDEDELHDVDVVPRIDRK